MCSLLILLATFLTGLLAGQTCAHAQDSSALSPEQAFGTQQVPLATSLPDKPTTAADALQKANELARAQNPDGLSEEQTNEHYRKKFQEVLTNIELALTLNPEPELRRQAMVQKFSILALLSNLGVEGMSQRVEAFLDSASMDADEEIAAFAKSMRFSARLRGLVDLSPEARNAQMIAIKEELLAAEPSKASLQQARHFLSISTRNVESVDAVTQYKQFVEHFKTSEDEQLKDAVKSLEGTISRLSLIGNAMEVTGQTLSGEPFHMESLKGKVILVDFWATWCGPCIAEFPEMRKLYQAYKPHGFEIVGISLDQDADKLTAFMEKQDVPWIVLRDPDTQHGWDNPVAVNYGIDGIPCMILVNQEGKVVSIDARGEKLKLLLADLFPDVSIPQESEVEPGDATAPISSTSS